MAEAGMMMAGSIASGYFGALDLRNQAKISTYNANVAIQQEKTAEAVGRYKSQQQAEAAERQASTTDVNIGSANIVSTAGTAIKVKSEEAIQGEKENLMVGYETLLEMAQHRSERDLALLQRKILRKAARYKETAGYLGAGATAFGAGMQAMSAPKAQTQLTGFSSNSSYFAPSSTSPTLNPYYGSQKIWG